MNTSGAQRTQQQLIFEKAAAERSERERLAKELEERKQQDLLSLKKILTDSERWPKEESLCRYM